jgi:amidase
VPIALGSDSGGSIRLPAAWCGTCGLRPTFGRVPLTGHFPRVGARSDARTAIGPMTASVDDLARVLAIINGPDGLDTGVAPVPLADPDSVAISSLRIGTVANGTPEHVLAALDRMRTAGASIADAALDDMRDEALDVTRRYWTRGRLSGAENERLLWDWDRFARRMATATHDVDVLVMPAVTEAAPPWRESIDTDYVWQLPWSLTGSPAVVVPFGDESGLPLSVQVVAPPWNDHIALAIASALTS